MSKHINAKSSSPGTLFVVATPIGNLEDITIRALRILKEVDLVACEDTRHTRKLLTHYDIHTLVESYHRHNEVTKAQYLVQKILAGDNIALVSDAGVPCISDPGFNLVACAHQSAIQVRSIPGPSALTAALSVSGLMADNFLFLGFVSSKKNERRRLFKALKMSTPLLAFYESPHRLRTFLKDCYDIFGNRQVAVCKEITKIYEQCFKGNLADVIALLAELPTIKGEYVVLIEGIVKQDEPKTENLAELLEWYRDNAELSLKDSVKKITSDLGLSRSEVYACALDIWGKK